MKLASIERIRALHPIANADKIEVAEVLGYRAVVQKGVFQTGDLCVFHFPDTIVNKDDPKYAFLAKQNFRIKTMKLRGVYSQGLVMPVSLISDKYGDSAARSVLSEGHDVSDVVKSVKYEKPAPQSLDALGHFPSFIPKTDEPNMQSQPEIMAALNGSLGYWSAKYDGCSGTFYHKGDHFGVCSRNLELKDGNNAFWNMARKYNLANLPLGGRNIAIQAEVYGPNIQGNKMGAAENKMAVFNIFDIDAQKYLDVTEMKSLCEQWGLPMVKIIWSGKFDCTLEQAQEMANNLTYDNGAPAEGMVGRPIREKQIETFERLSGKVISQVFAAKYGE